MRDKDHLANDTTTTPGQQATRRRLRLNKETLRRLGAPLSQEELDLARGGRMTGTTCSTISTLPVCRCA